LAGAATPVPVNCVTDGANRTANATYLPLLFLRHQLDLTVILGEAGSGLFELGGLPLR
jgi:hypothetical protein